MNEHKNRALNKDLTRNYGNNFFSQHLNCLNFKKIKIKKTFKQAMKESFRGQFVRLWVIERWGQSKC